MHVYRESGHLSSCKSNAQSVGAVCHDVVEVEPYLPCRRCTDVANHPAKCKHKHAVSLSIIKLSLSIYCYRKGWLMVFAVDEYYLVACGCYP